MEREVVVAEKVMNGRGIPSQADGHPHGSGDGRGGNEHPETGRQPFVRVRAIGRSALVEVTGIEYLTGDAARALIDELSRQVRDHRHTRLVVGLTGVRHASEGALSALARLTQRVRRRGGWVRLWGVDTTIRGRLRLTKLDEVLEVCHSRNEALGLLDR
jgi:anti-anti-sigma regulatory factor